MHPLRLHYDKLLLAAASLLLGWGLVQTREQGARMARLRTEPPAKLRQEAIYVPAPLPVLAHVAPTWSAPRESHTGPGGGVDLFTAPNLEHDRVANSFVREVSFPAEGAGPVLLAVKPEPFRFQLLGFVGRAGGEKVLLAANDRLEPLIAAVGQPLPDSTLILKRFELQRISVGENEAGPIHEAVAKAVLQDTHTGEEVTLDSRGPCYTGHWLAVFQGGGAGNESAELCEGDRLMVRDVSFRVLRIQPEPAEVVLGREKAPTETMTLRLASGAQSSPRASAPHEAVSPHLATTGD